MATYEALRQAIDTLIKANGNKEITGDILNNVLNTMLTALSANYQFCGEAKPNTAPGQPLQNVFYFAYEAGTYVNFGGITLPLGISMLKWDGTAWTGENIYTFDAQPLLNSSNLISSGAVFNALIKLSDAMHSGKVFADIANPSTVPYGLVNEQPIFYLATEKGTYSHFFANGDIPIVLEKDGIWILTSGADDEWNAVCLIEIDSTPHPLSNELISSKGVNNAIRQFGESFGFGKLYNGIATPTTTPDPLQGRRMFYLATQAGTYEHFFANGDIPLVLPHDGLYAIYSVTGSDDDDWNWEQILQFDDEVISNSHNLPTSMAVYNTLEAFKAEVNALIQEINPTVIEGNVTNAPDEEDLTSVNERLKFKDKEYNSLSASGLGRVYLRKNWVNGVNTLTQAMMNEANTIYHIQYDYVLGEDITVPANCVLEFDGGSVNGAYTITGQNTGIEAGLVKIFGTYITLTGTWNVVEAYPEWFGAKGDGLIDDVSAIKKCIESFCHTKLQKKNYLITPLILNNISNKIFDLNGGTIIDDGHLEETDRLFRLNQCSDFTIKNGNISMHTYLTNQFRHAIDCNGGDCLIFENLRIENSGGDGIYLGANCVTKSIVSNCYINASRRNGISISNGIGIIVSNCILKNSDGHNPQSGIDIEPNPIEGYVIKDILITDCIMSGNTNYGIQISPHCIGESNNIKIDNCVLRNNGKGLRIHFGEHNTALCKIEISNIQIIDSKSNSIDFGYIPKSMSTISIENINIYNSNTESGVNEYDNAIVLFSINKKTTEEFTLNMGNVNMNDIHVYGVSSNVGSIFFFYNQSADISYTDILVDNVTINNPITKTVNVGYRNDIGIIEPTVNVKSIYDYSSNREIRKNDLANIGFYIYTGKSLNINADSIYLHEGTKKRVYYKDGAFNINTNDIVIYNDVLCHYIQVKNTSVKDSYIEFTLRNGKWIVTESTCVAKFLDSNNVAISTTGATNKRPILSNDNIGYMYYDSTLNKPVWYKGNDVWVDATGATV